jgi:PAS domain S-box-containing protein
MSGAGKTMGLAPTKPVDSIDFYAVINSIPAPIVVTTDTGEVEAANAAILEYFGMTIEQLKGWRSGDWIHPDDLPRAVAKWKQALETGRGYENESRHRRHDGVFRWVQARVFPLRDNSGRIARWLLLQTDIHDRKQAEEALAANERKLDLIINTMPALAWSARPDGSTDFFNRHYLDYIGLSLDEARDWGWTAGVHPDDLSGVAGAWQSILASGAPGEAEARLRRRDGEYRRFLFRVSPLRDENGQIVKWFGVNTDIEDRKRAEEELRRAQAKLTEIGRVLTMRQLTASIAHEVNQPLSGIITNANTCLRMLAANPPNVEGALETARRTIRDGNRASEVVKRLRALFNQKNAALEPVDLNDAAREVIALSMNALQSEGVILRVDLADGLPAASGDRVQLQQVILNLIQNALDAMRSLNGRGRKMEVTTAHERGSIRLSVRDEGVGFSPEDAERLFDAFYTTKSEGMGIGLSLSRSIIERHGGRMGASLNEGPGATFSFSLPVFVKDATGVSEPASAKTTKSTESELK